MMKLRTKSDCHYGALPQILRWPDRAGLSEGVDLVLAFRPTSRHHLENSKGTNWMTQ